MFKASPPCALLLLAACGRSSQPQALAAPVPIVVAQARRIQEPERVSVSGVLASPCGSATAGFLVPGRVAEVLLREGEPVRKGQALALLETTALQHALDASHAQAMAAQALARQAEDEYQRMKQLFDSQSLAPNDFGKARAGREAALQQAQQALAGEAIARKNLAEARLVAPVAGYIARRMVEPGVIVAAGQPVFELAVLDPIEVSVGVPETDLHLVRVGQQATVTVPAQPGRTFPGTVKVVNISADPASRTYLTRIRLANPGRTLKVGMVAEVAITGAQRVDMVVVPAEAIVRDPQGATLVYHYYPDQKRVFAKRVEVGVPVGRELQIRAGLKDRETIVVAGQNALRNGMAAEPVPQP